MNRNVNAALFFSLTISISETSWGYAALSGYLFEVGHSNAKVGLAEGLQGIAQLLAALVAGEMADKISRRKPIRIGIVVGLLAIFSLWIAMFAPFSTENDKNAYWVATFGLFMWGSFRGVTLAPLDALFADSVQTAKRAKYQVRKYIATLAGATIGPLLAVVVFRNVGDTWTKNELRVVITAGTAFAIIPLLSLFLFDDLHALDEGISGPLLSLKDEMNDLNSRRIRILCFTADLLGGLASGMSIKFFPLFFRDQTHLSPGEVNSVTIVTTFLMIWGSRLSQTLAKRIGRMPTILIYKFTGIAILFVMALEKSLWSDWKIIVPIYVVRTVLMNATAPLHKSVLMDHCGKKERARWSALDSVVSFGWSGSALLGGVLADAHGFGYTFLITAILQALGFLALCALAMIVDDHADDQRLAAEESRSGMDSRESLSRGRAGSGVLVADDVSGTFVHTEQVWSQNDVDAEDTSVDEDDQEAQAEYRLIADDETNTSMLQV